MPWLSWSWGPWSVSPGAPAWTSLKTSGVGVGPLPREGFHEALTLGPPGHLWPAYHAYVTAGPILGGTVEAGAPPESRCWWRRGARRRGEGRPSSLSSWELARWGGVGPHLGLEQGSWG